VLVVAAAWAVQVRLSASPSAKGRSAYTVSVVRTGQVVRRFSVAELHALRQTTIQSGGKPQEGPSVDTVLGAAGVDGYVTLVVRGMGAQDKGLLTVPASKVTTAAVLDFARRGTVKLVAPDGQLPDRVRDVTVLEVR
jgi:hypothetical protein